MCTEASPDPNPRGEGIYIYIGVYVYVYHHDDDLMLRGALPYQEVGGIRPQNVPLKFVSFNHVKMIKSCSFT